MEDNQVLDDFNFNSEFTPDVDKETIELVGSNKFILLYLLSLGLYGLWWMYKSWRFFKEKDRLDIMPAARTIFAIFFTYDLFDKILLYAKSKEYQYTYSSGGLFVAFILINVLAQLPDPLWLISLLGFLPLIQPVQALNYGIANSNKYNAIEKNGLNGRQTALAIVGGIFWILILIGLMMPVEEF